MTLPVQIWTSMSGRSRALDYGEGLGALHVAMEPRVWLGDLVEEVDRAEIAEAIAWCNQVGWQLGEGEELGASDRLGGILLIDITRPGATN